MPTPGSKEVLEQVLVHLDGRTGPAAREVGGLVSEHSPTLCEHMCCLVLPGVKMADGMKPQKMKLTGVKYISAQLVTAHRDHET